MATKKFITLVAGRPTNTESVVFDEANVPTSDEKAGISGATGANPAVLDDDARNTNARTPVSHTNSQHSETYIEAAGVTYENLSGNGDVGSASSTVAAGDDGRFATSDEKAALAAEGTPSASNKYVTKEHLTSVVNSLDPQDSITHGVDYVKTDSGAPSGTPIAGEKCLNTNEAKLYTESALSWDAGAAVSSGDRFCHKDTGDDDSSDSGTHTKSDKTYDYDGSTFTEIVPNEGFFSWFEDEDKSYRYNGSDYVGEATTQQHNNVSGIQGGTNDEYFHLTSNQEAGMDAATAITGSNPPLTLLDRDKLPVCYTFRYDGGFAEDQTDVEPYDILGTFQRVQMPSAGSIVKTSIQSSAARTAGTLDMEPTVNGTEVTENALDLQINDSETTKDRAEAAPATTNLTFTGGQELGAKLTSSADWANADGDLRIDIYVVFDT